MDSEQVVASLAALAQGSRLRIFKLLVQSGASGLAASEIALALRIAPTTLSFHLKELSHAGLLKSRPVGRFNYYSADYTNMTMLIRFLTENCCMNDCGTPCEANAPPARPRRASRNLTRTS